MLLPLITAPPALADASLDFASHARQLSLAGPVYVHGSAAQSPLPASSLLKPALSQARVIVGPFAPSDLDAATAFLDAGALAAVVALAAADAASLDADARRELAGTLASLPASRLCLLLQDWQPTAISGDDESPLREVVAQVGALWLGLAPHAPLPSSAEVTALRASLRLGEACRTAVLLAADADLAAVSPAEVGRLHAVGCDVVAAAARVPRGEAAAAAAAAPLDVGACFAACARSDRPDGLFATVVADECGKSLGLVYSSTASLCEAVRCQRGVYYSRSRGGLWRKGDSSGAVQELLGMRLDCDSDAVLFTVRQLGAPPAFCHLNTRTCWGEDGGLTALQRVLQSRMASAPAGSYTKRLFDDGALLRHKLLEEAQELAEAAEPDHVAAEAADLIYFALVAAVKGGASLADVERHLDHRALKLTRRPGHAKEARILAAERELATAAAAKAGGAPPQPSPRL